MYKKLIKEVEKIKQENAKFGIVLRTEQIIKLATQVLTKEEFNEFLKMREKYEEIIEHINFMSFIMTDELEYIEE
jgi:hypothetical protein